MSYLFHLKRLSTIKWCFVGSVGLVAFSKINPLSIIALRSLCNVRWLTSGHIRSKLRKSTHFEVWNCGGEGGSQPSGDFEDLLPTSKAKTVKDDSKNAPYERGVPNAFPAGFS